MTIIVNKIQFYFEYQFKIEIFVHRKFATQKCNAKTNKTSVKILDMGHVKTPTEVKEEMLSVQYWRNEFDRLNELYPNFQRINLVIYDDYFLMAIAKDDVSHVKKGEAGLEKTRRVVLALQKLVDFRLADDKAAEKLRRRQKLERV